MMKSLTDLEGEMRAVLRGERAPPPSLSCNDPPSLEKSVLDCLTRSAPSAWALNDLAVETGQPLWRVTRLLQGLCDRGDVTMEKGRDGGYQARLCGRRPQRLAM